MIVMVPNSTNRVVILTDVRHGGQISRNGGQINKNANITWQNYNTWHMAWWYSKWGNVGSSREL